MRRAGAVLSRSPNEQVPVGVGTSRTIYAFATDPEACVPNVVVEQLRGVLGTHGEPAALDELIERTQAWSRETGTRFCSLLEPADSTQQRRLLVRRAALGTAPLALMSGAWLQWLSSPGNADDPLTLQILALYAVELGVGQPAASRGSAYLELLRRLRISDNAVPAARLTNDQRIADAPFQLPALLLLLSRRPEDFRGELLGADLCLRAAGLLPPLAMIQQECPNIADWTAFDPAAARTPATPASLELCRAIVDALLDAKDPKVAVAIGNGFGWALAALQAWAAALYDELSAAREPAYEMAELMRQRAREGSVYHHQFLIEGRSLADWLEDSRSNPGPLLEALSRSKLIKPGRSEASSLVRGLVSERGPMFRVFSEEDLSIIKRWIDSLPAAAAVPTNRGSASGPEDGRLARMAEALRPAAKPPGKPPGDLREAYRALMSRTGSPELRDWCHDYVIDRLARCRRELTSGAGPLPVVWQPEGLRPWLQAQHDLHGADFQENAKVPLPPREAVVNDTLQTAPLTLIDGSWLQGFTDYEQASSAIGHSLFETYWDELGNGEPSLNHPLIYRQVMAEMGLHLPPTASVEFARWSGLRLSSFELPVYWLCIGRFPRTFLPEVLGLNLAMELSGVGGAYRRARQALKSYGFSTRFVDIHNTIDNVATGHSAWAADAVDTLLAGLPASPGPAGQAATWERVRTGYHSLSLPSNSEGRRTSWRTLLIGRRRV